MKGFEPASRRNINSFYIPQSTFLLLNLSRSFLEWIISWIGVLLYYFNKKKLSLVKIENFDNYHFEPVVVLHQFLWVSKKFEIAVSFVKILVRSSAWDFFCFILFFYSFSQFSFRSWDVEFHTKFQHHKIFFDRIIQCFLFLKKPFQHRFVQFWIFVVWRS